MTEHHESTAETVAEDPRLSAWLDNELAPAERREVDELLETDSDWSDARDDTASVRTLVRDLGAAEPPVGFLEALLTADVTDEHGPDERVTDLDAARRRRLRRSTAAFGALAAAAAVLIAVIVPGATRAQPALATDVRVHQAGVSSSSDPVSALATLGGLSRLGK